MNHWKQPQRAEFLSRHKIGVLPVGADAPVPASPIWYRYEPEIGVTVLTSLASRLLWTRLVAAGTAVAVDGADRVAPAHQRLRRHDEAGAVGEILRRNRDQRVQPGRRHRLGLPRDYLGPHSGRSHGRSKGATVARGANSVNGRPPTSTVIPAAAVVRPRRAGIRGRMIAALPPRRFLRDHATGAVSGGEGRAEAAEIAGHRPAFEAAGA